MLKNKNLFNYQNKIILKNGATIRITSVKYIKNYELNLYIFKKEIQKNISNNNIQKNKKNIFGMINF